MAKKKHLDFGAAFKRYVGTGDLSDNDLKTIIRGLRVVVPYIRQLPEAYHFMKVELSRRLSDLEDYRYQRTKKNEAKRLPTIRPDPSGAAPGEGSPT